MSGTLPLPSLVCADCDAITHTCSAGFTVLPAAATLSRRGQRPWSTGVSPGVCAEKDHRTRQMSEARQGISLWYMTVALRPSVDAGRAAAVTTTTTTTTTRRISDRRHCRRPVIVDDGYTIDGEQRLIRDRPVMVTLLLQRAETPPGEQFCTAMHQ